MGVCRSVLGQGLITPYHIIQQDFSLACPGLPCYCCLEHVAFSYRFDSHTQVGFLGKCEDKKENALVKHISTSENNPAV